MNIGYIFYTPHIKYMYWLMNPMNPEDSSNRPADHITLCSLMSKIIPAMTKLFNCGESGSS